MINEHIPVFCDEVLSVFRQSQAPIQWVFDGTFGRGGHCRVILDEWKDARIIAFDQDQAAIDHGKKNFANEIASGRLKLFHCNYSQIDEVKEKFAAEMPSEFQLILLDLGVSSPQLNEAERGFSFYHDGPLDMRMDQRAELTAADIVNEWSEQDLARLFIEYGEVSSPFRVVRAIVHDRKTKKTFSTTRELASMIERVDGWRKKGAHPAKQYFLALRIKVNEELETLTQVLPKLIGLLADGGIFAVITFHSLEDRIVKNIFKSSVEQGRLVNKKVIKPSEKEVLENPRSRSAKLRAFQKNISQGAR